MLGLISRYTDDTKRRHMSEKGAQQFTALPLSLHVNKTNIRITDPKRDRFFILYIKHTHKKRKHTSYHTTLINNIIAFLIKHQSFVISNSVLLLSYNHDTHTQKRWRMNEWNWKSQARTHTKLWWKRKFYVSLFYEIPTRYWRKTETRAESIP